MPKRLLPLTLLACSLMFAGCKPGGSGGGGSSSSTPTTGDILIGHYGSLTGSEATFGKSTHDGIKLAIDEINAAGGINGREDRAHQEYDDKGDASEAGIVVTRLVTNDKVVAVLGEVASRPLARGGADLPAEQGCR